MHQRLTHYRHRRRFTAGLMIPLHLLSFNPELIHRRLKRVSAPGYDFIFTANIFLITNKYYYIGASMVMSSS
jgi:hypothetical protein